MSAIDPLGASLSKFSTSTENEDMRSRASTILKEPYFQGTIGTVFNCEQGVLRELSWGKKRHLFIYELK